MKLTVTKQRQRMAKIVADTIKFYGKDPANRRSLIGGNCVYNSKNGTHCAIGRKLKNIHKEKGVSLPCNDDDVDSLAHANGFGDIDEMLVDSARGLSLDFWNDLQNIHDHGTYWDDINGGLSESGKKEVARFRKAIRTSKYYIK